MDDNKVTSDIKVSIITRTKNRPQFLKRACESLINQTFKNYEWIIVNDAGDISHIEKVHKTDIGADHPTKLINLSKPCGRGKAAIAGMEAAKGVYCLFHDDDDALLPGALMRYVEELEKNPGAVAVIGGVKTITEKLSDSFPHERFEAMKKVKTYVPKGPLLLMDLAYNNTLMTISTLFRRDVYLNAGGINPKLAVLEDWDLWLRMMLIGDFITISEVLSIQYVRRDSGNDLSQSSREDHLKSEIFLRNHYLRKDINNGVQGLGYLMNVHHRKTLEELSALMGIIKKIKKIILFWT